METGNRISHYYRGVDGCRLAVDLYFPDTVQVVDGRVVHYQKKIPLILKGGYDERRSVFEFEGYAICELTKAGFAVAIAEQRGVGASFGSNHGFFTRLDARDMVCLIDTLAEEEWCSGRVGMYGGSNKGMIQQITVAEYTKKHGCRDENWHLEAVIPGDANANLYYQNYPNGASSFPDGTGRLKGEPRMGVPVDEDPECRLAREAMEEHRNNKPFLSQYLPNMKRDSRNHALGYVPCMEIPAWCDMDEIKYSGISIYQNGGWFDPGCTGEILEYKSWGGRLLLGPWTHYELYVGGGSEPDGKYDWVRDYVNFFEEKLMDKNHDISNQPPIRYYMQNALDGENWRWTADFPLDGQANTYFYMDASAQAGNAEEAYQMKMGEQIPQTAATHYTHREAELYGPMGRAGRKIKKDMTPLDQESITFTGPVLKGNVEIVGIPVVRLYVTSTFTDGNFIAVLEEVTPDGVSHFITDGCMRASHAQIHPNESWDSMGLPYHRGMQEDMVALSESVPLELNFNMEATAYTLRKGSRLRIAIMTGEQNFHSPKNFPAVPPEVTLYTGKDYPSYIRVPVIKPSVNRFEGFWKSRDYEGKAEVYTFCRGIYVNYQSPAAVTENERSQDRGKWLFYPSLQVYEEDGEILYETEAFTARKKGCVLQIEDSGYSFKGEGKRPDTVNLWENSEYLGKILPWHAREYPAGRIKRSTDYKDVKVANVPVLPGIRDIMNPQPYNTMNLLMDILLPHKGISDESWEQLTAAEKEKIQEGQIYPCIVFIHGFGMDNHARELIIPELLEEGYAVACTDYRTWPPNIWPEPSHDVKAAIRWAKANAESYHLDKERFGVMGCSCGGHLAAMVAATNGKASMEGNIGGNLQEDSSVKAAAIFFPWTDAFTFGEENREKYPGEPERVAMSDGPMAPLGCVIGFSGPGKGMGELKKHRLDPEPYYRELWQKAVEASPISHVSESSAPSVFIHGNYECGIQIPMAQSIDMFEALTRKGVKSLLLCNNGCVYGEDPEVRRAVVDFIKNRV